MTPARQPTAAQEPVLVEDTPVLGVARAIIRVLMGIIFLGVVGWLTYTFVACMGNADAIALVRTEASEAKAKAVKVEELNAQQHAIEEKLNRERFEELQRSLNRIERKLDERK